MIESLLAKPSSKPAFNRFDEGLDNGILKRVQAFLPHFIQSTDRILSSNTDEHGYNMDIKIMQ